MANNRFIFPVGGTPESVRTQIGAVGPAPEPGSVPAPVVGEVLTWDGTQWVPGPGGGGITELTGDVTAGPGTGSQAASVVGIQGTTVSATAPLPGFTLSYDGTEWVPAIEGFEYFFGSSLTQNPAANVYSSWSDMFAAIALQPTGVTPIIWIMENTTVPPGTWNMRFGTLKSPVYVTGAITLLCPAGVTLDNLASIENGLVVEMSPTVAGSSLTFSAGIGAEVLLVGLAAALRNTGTAALWVTPGSGTTVVLAINGVPWNAFAPPVITAPIIQGTAGDTIILSSALSLTQMPADWIAGTGTLVLTLPTNEEPVALSGWLGTTVTNQAQVVYPALSAQYAGSVAAAPVPSGGSYSCVRGDELVRVAPTGVGGISVTLLAANACAGQTTTVKKTTSDVIDAITVSAASGNIDGAASYALPASAYSVLGFRSDGSDWWVV